jgi:EpsI family protein
MAVSIDQLTPAARSLTRPSAQVLVWLLIALGVAALWPSVAALARVWGTMADYNHGALIAAISVVWLLQVGGRIQGADVRPTPAMLPVLAAVLLGWAVAYRANSELMQQLALPVVLALAVWCVLGPRVLRQIAPPIAFFYFAIPLWDHFVPLLQWLTTQVAEGALWALGVPISVEGHHVTIPAGRFSIIEGCSGMRYFIIGLAFAALAGALQRLTPRRLAILFALAIGVALLTNWLRVITVIYAGHLSAMQHYLVAVEHKSLGYAMFVPMLVAIVSAARRLGGAESQASSPAPRKPASVSIAVFGAAVALLSAPVYLWAQQNDVEARSLLGTFPLLTGEWQGPLPAAAQWRPRFVGASDERRASYSRAGQRVEVYLNAYGPQSPGQELVFHRNSVAPADQWTLVRTIGASAAGPSMMLVTDGSGDRWIVTREYVVGGRATADPALAQLYYGLQALVRPTASGLVAFAAACKPDCDAAVERVASFRAGDGRLFLELIPTTPQDSAGYSHGTPTERAP